MGYWTLVGTHVLVLLLGTAFGVWLNHRVARPRLVVNGAGGHGGPESGFRVCHLSVQNQPGILRVRLDSTISTGMRVAGSIEKAFRLDRNPAHECSARLVDKDTSQDLAWLWWRTPGGERPFEPTVAIGPGHSVDLMLFARLESEPARYFAYQPSGDGRTPKLPAEVARFDDTRDFVVRIEYSYGRQRLSFPVTVRKEADGRLSLEYPEGGRSL
jgi:hypothetical protein